MDTYFAVTAPGVAEFTALELTRLGLTPDVSPTGVTFSGGLPALYRANLRLRTASRILVRLGQWFYARSFDELRQRAARLPWERFLSPGQPVALRVTCHSSKLYHSDAVGERVAAVIADRLGKPSPLQKPTAETSAPAQLIIVRLENDRVTVSFDSSGQLLHRRGYRLASAKAPLRETLAAALLMASGWDAASPLIDPFCGSGTLPIEAALLALGLPPGRNRHFAFMDWPDFDAALWQQTLAEAAPPVAAPPPFIFGADRDAGAIKMAQENAARAGVAQFIQFRCQAVSNLRRSPLDGLPPGWLVTNPPYGLRLSAGKDLRNLYAQFGNVLRAGFSGWQLGALSSDLALLGQLKIKLDNSLRLVNGGTAVTFGRGRV